MTDMRANKGTFTGPIVGVEATAPAGIAASDLMYPDSTAHRWKMNNNNAGADAVVGAATVDTLSNKTMTGASAANAVTKLSFQNNLAPVTGNGADQVFFTFTIPANTLGVNKGIRVSAAWQHTTGSANIVYHSNCGGVIFSNYGSIADASSSKYSVQYLIFNLGGGFAMKSDQFLCSNIIGFIPSGTSWATGLAVDFTLSQAVTLSFNVAATDAVTPDMFLVELIQ